MYRHGDWVIVPPEVSKKLMRINSKARRYNRRGPMYGTEIHIEDVQMDDKPLVYNVRFTHEGFIHHALFGIVQADRSFVWVEVRNEKTKPINPPIA
jgi:hypothetical protein